MYENPILNEVRQMREELLAEYDGDVEALFRDLMEEQKTSGREYVQPPAHLPRKTPQNQNAEALVGTQGES